MRWICAIALLALAGCGGDPEDSAPLVPVTGTITLNGKPAAGAKVTFMPDPGNKYNTPGVDATGPEGNYKLMFKTRSGVSAGKYKVSVETAFVPPPGEAIPEAFKNDPFMFQKSLEAKNLGKKAEKKAFGAKEDFEAEVTGKADVFDFDVKAAPK